MQGGHVRLFFGRQAVEVFAAGQQLGGHVVLFAFGGQQHLEQRHERRGRPGSLTRTRRVRKRVVGQGCRVQQGCYQALAGFALGPAAGDAPDAAECLGSGGGRRGDFQQAFVLQQALAGDVDPLRLTLAPGSGGAQLAQQAAVAGARPQALPHRLRVRPVGERVGQDRHFFRDPRRPALLREFFKQPFVHDAQPRHVGRRIHHLRGR